MIKEMQIWFNENARRFQNSSCIIELYIPGAITDNPSARIDIISKTCFARMTVWESGECEEEALDSETGKTIFYYSHFFESFAKLQDCLNEFIGKVGC